MFLALGPRPDGSQGPVGLKRLLPHLRSEEGILAMFRDEIRLAARFDHPNVVRFFGSGEDRGSPYLVMEHVPGRHLGCLRELALRHHGPVPIPIVVAIADRMCAGLIHVHDSVDDRGQMLNVVHRDVSPHNVLMGTGGEVKLTDFGISRNEAMLRETGSGGFKGKFGYVAPELVEGRKTDRRADIFSLGVILWELLIGTRLFVGDSPGEVLRLISECKVPDPSDRREGVPAVLASALTRALAREPKDRYQGADELREELADVQAGGTRGQSREELARYVSSVLAAADVDPMAGQDPEEAAAPRSALDLLAETTSGQGRDDGTVWQPGLDDDGKVDRDRS